MPLRPSFLIILVSAFLAMSLPVVAGDVEELEASFEQVLERLQAKDLDGFLKMWHPEAVLITRGYPFPVDSADAGPEVWREIFDDFFQGTDKTAYIPMEMHYRVIGETGMVWGTAQFSITLKDSTTRNEMTRLSAVLVKSEGKWKIISWHGSERPGRLGAKD